MTSTDQGGNKIQKSLTDINPQASSDNIRQLATGLNGLTTNSYVGTNRIDKTSIDSDTRTPLYLWDAGQEVYDACSTNEGVSLHVAGSKSSYDGMDDFVIPGKWAISGWSNQNLFELGQIGLVYDVNGKENSLTTVFTSVGVTGSFTVTFTPDDESYAPASFVVTVEA